MDTRVLRMCDDGVLRPNPNYCLVWSDTAKGNLPLRKNRHTASIAWLYESLRRRYKKTWRGVQLLLREFWRQHGPVLHIRHVPDHVSEWHIEDARTDGPPTDTTPLVEFGFSFGIGANKDATEKRKPFPMSEAISRKYHYLACVGRRMSIVQDVLELALKRATLQAQERTEGAGKSGQVWFVLNGEEYVYLYTPTGAKRLTWPEDAVIRTGSITLGNIEGV